MPFVKSFSFACWGLLFLGAGAGRCPAADWAAPAAADAQQDRTSIPYAGKTPDNRHRAVHYSAKLPPLTPSPSKPSK